MNNIEKKLDALIEALGFDIERTVDRKMKEISEKEGLYIINQNRYSQNKEFSLAREGDMTMRLKRGKKNSYFKYLNSPEVTFTLKKRV